MHPPCPQAHPANHPLLSNLSAAALRQPGSRLHTGLVSPFRCNSAAVTAEPETQQAPTDFDTELARRLDRTVRSHSLREPLDTEDVPADTEQRSKKNTTAKRRAAREPLTDTPIELLPKAWDTQLMPFL